MYLRIFVVALAWDSVILKVMCRGCCFCGAAVAVVREQCCLWFLVVTTILSL